MDADADALYGLPRDEFIARRGELAKSLRKAGRRSEAAEVAALRKPSIAAWAVNQLVRTQRSSVRELFEAGDELRDAQAQLLAGSGDGRALRAAAERERAAVDELVELGRGLLSSAGVELSSAVIERVSDSLHAAALDEHAREQVRDGRLERELRHVGLGFGLGVGDAPARVPKDPASAEPAPMDRADRASADRASADRAPADGASKPSPADARAERERAAAERADAERARRDRLEARRNARAAHATARRHADAADRALEDAKQRREDAAQGLRDADEAVAAAVARAAAAAAALARAEADLADAEGHA